MVKSIKKDDEKSSLFVRDRLTEMIKIKTREFIEETVEEELNATLGAGWYERTGVRQGYRNGYHEPRTLSTSVGPTTINVPRGRIKTNGKEEEWHSTILPRYARRAVALDQAILGIYFAGVNTRRIKKALRPLLRGTPLSKSAVSRLIQRLKSTFEEWETQSLRDVRLKYLYLDGFVVKVRVDRRVVKVPVLVALGVMKDGRKVVLALHFVGSESGEAWKGILEDLSRRGLRTPKLIMSDGSPGLQKAIREVWPKVNVQRCTVHKLRNLLAKAPKHSQETIKEDYDRIVYADNLEEAENAYKRFIQKWRTKCEGVVKSLEEGGEELLTFYRYPKTQWRSLRTTNAIERLNEELRRRTKTQGSLPSEKSVLLLLFGLLMSGQIKMNKINGWRDMPLDEQERKADENEELQSAA